MNDDGLNRFFMEHLFHDRNIKNIKYLYSLRVESIDNLIKNGLFDNFVMCSELWMIKFAYELMGKNYDFNSNNGKFFKIIFLYGKLDIVKWVWEKMHEPELDQWTIDKAAESGFLEILKWLMSEPKFKFDIHDDNEKCFREAVRHGRITIMNWIYDNKRVNLRVNNDFIFRTAAEYGQIFVIEWLIKKDPTIDIRAQNDYAFKFAAKNGHTTILRWLLEKNPSINVRMMDDFPFELAVYYKHLGTIKWLWKKSNKTINIKKKANIAFTESILNKNISIAKWIMKTAPITVDFDKLLIAMVAENESKHFGIEIFNFLWESF